MKARRTSCQQLKTINNHPSPPSQESPALYTRVAEACDAIASHVSEIFTGAWSVKHMGESGRGSACMAHLSFIDAVLAWRICLS